MAKIEEIKGTGPEYANSVDIEITGDLLNVDGTKKGRIELSYFFLFENSRPLNNFYYMKFKLIYKLFKNIEKR